MSVGYDVEQVATKGEPTFRKAPWPLLFRGPTQGASRPASPHAFNGSVFRAKRAAGQHPPDLCPPGGDKWRGIFAESGMMNLLYDFQPFLFVLLLLFSLFLANGAYSLFTGISNRVEDVLQVFQGVAPQVATVDIVYAYLLQHSQDGSVLLLVGLYEFVFFHDSRSMTHANILLLLEQTL
jgi:hypothetical protein